jgi:hypothetical protein
MDAKQRESNEAGEQPQMDLPSLKLWRASCRFTQMWCSATEAKISFARDASVNFCASSRLFRIGNYRRYAGAPIGRFAISGRRDSNPRPLEPHSSALPSCATARFFLRTAKMPRSEAFATLKRVRGSRFAVHGSQFPFASDGWYAQGVEGRWGIHRSHAKAPLRSLRLNHGQRSPDSEP